MRLAQAARDLSITTDDIITFLEKKGITIEKDSNTKLTEESVSLLFDNFETPISRKQEKEETEAELSPEIIEENQVEAIEDNATLELTENSVNKVAEIPEQNNQLQDDITVAKEEETEELVLKETAKEPAAYNETETDEVKTPKEKKYQTVTDLLESEEEFSDDVVIKAPKVSLQGLNVLGKIELPEPKPKAEKVKPEVGTDKKPAKKHSDSRRRREPVKRNRRELTPQQIREREQKRESRKREEDAKLEKRRKEKYYKEKILRPKQEQQKNRKPKKRKEVEPANTPQNRKPQPTTVLGKFWRWLNT